MTECRSYNSQGDLLTTFDTNTMGPVITIGRSSKSNVSLKGLVDTTVSREHLVLERMLTKWTVTNKSRFGMFKSGEKFVTTELEEGDVIRFTKLFLCYGPTAKPSAYDITWDIETENGQKRAVLWPGLNSIGASNDNYITVRAPDVSRVHGYINVLTDRITFKPVAQDNPSYLNGEEILLLAGDRHMGVDSFVSKHVTLKKGKNVLRGATINGIGMSEFCARFVDDNGKPVTNFTVSCN